MSDMNLNCELLLYYFLFQLIYPATSNAILATTRQPLGFFHFLWYVFRKPQRKLCARSATHYNVTIKGEENPHPSLFPLDTITEGGTAGIDQQRPLRLCCGFFSESDRKLRGNYYLRRADSPRLSYNLSVVPPGQAM